MRRLSLRLEPRQEKPCRHRDLTMNPTIDVSTTAQRVHADEKLRCEPPQRQPGGGGINVARVVALLGREVIAVYPAGGPNGEEIKGNCLWAPAVYSLQPATVIGGAYAPPP
ncbi:MAG: PfkB family carbohydrate kinase [Nitriliruptorales bacterium]